MPWSGPPSLPVVYVERGKDTMKGTVRENSARVHGIIPHEYELKPLQDMRELINECKPCGVYDFDCVWNALERAFECGYRMGHVATIEGQYEERKE